MRRRCTVLTLMAMLLGVCRSASAWEYEQVDTAGTWGRLEVEVMPGGEICLAYADTGTWSLYLARNDSGWRHMILGTTDRLSTRSLVRGPGGRPAVLLRGEPLTFMLETDTGWTRDTLPWSGDVVGLAFDDSGTALVSWFSPPDMNMNSAMKMNGDWVRDIISQWIPGMQQPEFGGSLGCVASASQFHVSFSSHLRWTGGSYDNLCLSSGRTDTWTTRLVAGGTWCFAAGQSFARRGPNGVTTCYNFHHLDRADSFYCDGTMIEERAVSLGLVRADSTERRQIVYRTDRLRYVFETSPGNWQYDTLPATITRPLSFALDGAGWPLIAFISPQGIFLARGDAVGAEERTTPRATRPTPYAGPTVVRGGAGDGDRPKLQASSIKPAAGCRRAAGPRTAPGR